jgi:hypothetical protein
MQKEDYDQIESSMRQHHEHMKHYEEMCLLGEKRIFELVVILKPTFSRDGNMFCFLYGENLQEGIAGFGETPYKAAEDFVNNFNNEKCKVVSI